MGCSSGGTGVEGGGAGGAGPQYKEPSTRSELAVIQPLWSSVDLSS